MTPFHSQLLGIALAVTTAFGCLGYERLVKVSPYWLIGLLVSLHYVPFWVGAIYFQRAETIPDLRKHWVALSLFLTSGVTAPLWYYITRKQGLLVSSTYEIKYIVILSVFYILFGEQKVTAYTSIGIALALLSVWFLSQQK